MPLPALGLEERVGIGIEAFNAYGTGVAPTDTMLSESFGMEKIQPKEPVPGRFGPVRGFHGVAAANPRRIALPGKVQGPWTFPFTYNRPMGLVIYNLLCKDSGGGDNVGYTFTSGKKVDGTAGSTNQHIFKMQNHTLDQARAMSLTRFNGQRQDKFRGCYIRSFELTVPENGVAMVNCDVLGQSIQKNTAESLPAISTATPYTRITEMILKYDPDVNNARGTMFGTQANIFSFSLRVEHVLRELAGSNDGVTVQNSIMQPFAIDYSRVSGSFRLDWNSNDWQEIWDADAGTIIASYITLEARFKSEVLSGADPFDFVIRMPACHVSGTYPKDPGGPGPIPQEITFEADICDVGGGVFETLNMELYNADTTYGTIIDTP
jgi:hypothetical protein